MNHLHHDPLPVSEGGKMFCSSEQLLFTIF